MLNWGRRYVMVEPTHFRVDYTINPFMDPLDQPDRALAMRQWRSMVATIEDLGGIVDVVEQRADAPDMVFAMNLGLVADHRVVLSHMRYPQRRMETDSARAWFEAHGYPAASVGSDAVGPHLEAGDVFAWGDGLVAGYGPRTEELALKHLAAELGVRVRGLRITHPGMYHLDLAFCPLDERRAIVCPAALDDASAQVLMDLVPEPLVLSEEEALTTFAANSIVVPGEDRGVDGVAPATVVMPDAPQHVVEQLIDWGFAVEIVDVSQFHKAGGSIRCLTNPVDLLIGRDLPAVLGGAVVLPPV